METVVLLSVATALCGPEIVRLCVRSAPSRPRRAGYIAQDDFVGGRPKTGRMQAEEVLSQAC